MNDFAALSRMLENLIRLGVIAAVQMEPPRVQVKTGKLLTAWLPWLALRAGADQEWDPPTEGEQVILFSPSGQLTNGIVVTGLFSDHIPANGNRPGLHRRTYADGAVIEYDSVDHHLSATLPDTRDHSLVSKGGINSHRADQSPGRLQPDRQPERGWSGDRLRRRGRGQHQLSQPPDHWRQAGRRSIR